MKYHLSNHIQDSNRKEIIDATFDSIQGINKSIIPTIVIDTFHHEDNGLLSGDKDRGIYIKPGQILTPIEAPNRIFDEFKNSSDVHLIWLSHSTFIKEDIFFAWVLNHEAGHFLQNIKKRPDSNLNQNIKRLRRKPEFIRLPPSTMIPNEIDADLFALDFCNNYFGKNISENYINNNGIERCPYPQYFRLLCSLIK